MKLLNQVNTHTGHPCLRILKIPAKSLLALKIRSGLIMATVLFESAIKAEWAYFPIEYILRI